MRRSSDVWAARNAAGSADQCDPAIEVARVRALHVTEGQTVHAGDVLVGLDSGTVDSDREKASGDAAIAASQAAGARALIAAIDSDRPPVLARNSGVARERWVETEQNLQGQYHVAKRRRPEGEISQAEAALPLALERERNYAQLSKENDVSRDAYLKKKQERIDLQTQLIDARNQRAVLIAENARRRSMRWTTSSGCSMMLHAPKRKATS